MWIATTSLVFVLAQTPPKIDRAGEAYLVQLMERYSKLPPFYLWFDRYSKEGESDGYDKGGTAQLWYGGGKQFRVSSCGSFGDDVLGVSDGKTLLVDGMDMSRAVELSNMPAKWTSLADRMAPNQNGTLVLWLMEGPGALDTLAAKDKPITLLRNGNAFVVSFTNPSLGDMRVEIVDGWMVADESVQKFDFDGEHFEFVNRNEYKPFVYSPKLPRGIFETTPAKGLSVVDNRAKSRPPQS